MALAACAAAPPAVDSGVDRACGCLREEASTTISPAAEAAPEEVAQAGQMTDRAAAAKRAFDRWDWATARPALEAVAAGHTADDAGNRQIAAYHAAIASYQLGDFEHAAAVLGAIARTPSHLKFRESLLWLVLLASEPRACAAASDAIARYDVEDPMMRFENPATEASRREARERRNLALLSAGRGLYRQGDYEAAKARLVMVDPTSRFAVRARECLSFVDERLSSAP
jgi:hypothetical protein